MKYIGVRSCKCNPNEDNYWSSSKYLKEDIVNIGVNNFEKQILKVWPSRKQAMEHEIELHEKYNVGQNLNFYNKSKQTSTSFDTTGSPSPCGMLGKKHTKETRQKMSLSKKGIPKTAEQNRKNSEAHKGKNNPFYGKTHTIESKRKISEASTGENNGMFGRKHSDEAKHKVSVANKGRVRDKVTCPHCGKIGAGPGMKMWHFDNCKYIYT